MSTVRRPGAGTARACVLGAPLLGLALAMLLVWQSSYSTFHGATTSGVNNWAAGTVSLSDNDSGAALFTTTPKLKPGSTGSRCIVVTSTGTVPTTVKLYGSGLATTNGLSSYLDLTITRGTGGALDCTGYSSSSPVFTGTLATFAATSWNNGYGTWAPTGSASESSTYRFDYTLNTGAPAGTQGGTAQISFVWEARS